MTSVFKGSPMAALRASSLLRGVPMTAEWRMAGGGGSDPAALIAEADFVAGTYMLDGEAVAFADLLTHDPTYTFAFTEGVGLQVSKLSGIFNGQMGKAYFTPALFALINQPGGYHVVLDYVFDNLHEEGGTIVFGGPGTFYGDASFAHVYKDVRVGRHEPLGAPSSEWGVNLVDYDYDTTPVVYDQQGRDGMAGAMSGQGYFSLNDTIEAYFGSDLSTIAQTTPMPFPDPDANIAGIYGLLNVDFPGTGQTASTARLTITRLRVYAGAQGGGWTPSA